VRDSASAVGAVDSGSDCTIAYSLSTGGTRGVRKAVLCFCQHCALSLGSARLGALGLAHLLSDSGPSTVECFSGLYRI
jgi:hypothetical protein